MATELRASGGAGLEDIIERVHDHWFSVSGVAVDLAQGVVRLSSGPLDWRLGGLVAWRRIDTPDAMRTLTIRNVKPALSATPRESTGPL